MLLQHGDLFSAWMLMQVSFVECYMDTACIPWS